MTPAQSFHPSFRDDLSTVPSEDEELAAASAPMEIITHDVNRLLEYLDGVDMQRMAEHDDVKDQLYRVEDELKKLADFVKQEAEKPPRVIFAPKSPEPVESTEDVIIHSAPRPAVILLDLPESPLRLSSGSVTESVAWLDSPSSVSTVLPVTFKDSAHAPSSRLGASSIAPSAISRSSLHPGSHLDAASGVHSLPGASTPGKASVYDHLSAAHSLPAPSTPGQRSDLDNISAMHSLPGPSTPGQRSGFDNLSSVHSLPSPSTPGHASIADDESEAHSLPAPSTPGRVSAFDDDASGIRSLPLPSTPGVISHHDLGSDAHSLPPPSSPGSSSSKSSISDTPSSLTRTDSLAPSDSISQRSLSIRHSASEAPTPAPSEASTARETMSVSQSETGTARSMSLLNAPPPSEGSTPSVASGSSAHTPISTPPRTRGNTPDIDIVSASGRGSPARSDITLRQAVSNAQLRDMLNDLRKQTDRLMDQQNRANEAIDELQNRPIQLPPLTPMQPTPRRSPYADLLSQIADTLRSIVDAGTRELPDSEDEVSVSGTEDTGATSDMANLQNRLRDVLAMPLPPRNVIPSSMGAPAAKEAPIVNLHDDAASEASSAPSTSLLEQHVADFPRIRRPVPRRGRLARSPSPSIRHIERPGTAPPPPQPMWGRPRSMYRTPSPRRRRVREPEAPEIDIQEATPSEQPLELVVQDAGPDLDMLKLVQDRRRHRRGGDGIFDPVGEHVVEPIFVSKSQPKVHPVDCY